MMVQTGSSGKKPSTVTHLSEINVTPMVDVMLVLLIIFMISAPLMQQGLQVQLPKANTGTLNDVEDQMVLTVHFNHNIELNGKRIQAGMLLRELSRLSTRKPNVQVFVHADERVPYGFLAQVIAEVKKARIHSVGLVTQPAQAEKRL